VDINQYIIRELLLKQEVVLPGFGKFAGKRETAHVDNQTVNPPRQIVSFIRDTNSFALDLAVLVAAEEKVSEDEAAKAITAFVELANTELENKKKTTFPGIGTVSQTDAGVFAFEQSESATLLADSFGMPPVDLSAIQNSGAKKKVSTETVVVKKERSFGFIWWILGIAAIVLLAAGLWWLFWEGHANEYLDLHNTTAQTTTEHTTTIVNNTTTIDSTFIDTTIVVNTQVANEPAAGVVQPAVEGTLAPVENAEQAESTFDNHLQNHREIYLVIGSFKQQDNAQTLQKNMQSQGYQSELLDGGNGFVRVTIGKFPTTDAAMVVYKKFTDAHPNDDIWAL
jgi:nucleoid DNA-binding protein/flagellar basal body-associated protein FliL